MAIALTAITSAGVTTGNIVTASVDPAANELWCVFMITRNQTVTPSISGTGLTWTLHTSLQNTQNQFKAYLWRGLSTSDPAAGAITITLTGNTRTALATIWKATGVDTSGTNGEAAIEVLAVDAGPFVDNRNMKVTITTLTNNAVVVGMGAYRNRTFTTPAGETTLTINNTAGSGGETCSTAIWYEAVPVANNVTIGDNNDISSAHDWLVFAVSLKIASAVPAPTAAAIVRARNRSFSAPRTITLSVFQPPAMGDAQVAEFSSQVSGYEHEVLADGGFWTARMSINDDQLDLEDWYERGLGRRVVAYSPDGVIIWEGITNSINLKLGGLSKTIGPVLDIANYVRLIYSFIAAGGLDIGFRATTVGAEDVDSQARYGIMERVLSTAGATSTEADAIRDLYLLERSRPGRSEELTIGNASGPSMDLECVGFAQFLSTYTYAITSLGTQNLSAKISDVIAAHPSNLFTAGGAYIETNTLQVQVFDDDGRTAWNIIKELVSRGDASNNRWLFGVYADRQAHYYPVVDEVSYMQTLSDPGQRVFNAAGGTIEPWYIKPGRWLRVLDFMAGGIPDTTDLRDDPQCLFIESVTFRAPQMVTLRGGRVSRLDQKLARMGLGGIGG
jgi:hypothetical protein